MFFRNLVFFRFPVTHDLSALDKHLAEAKLKPVGPLELSSRGFVSPYDRNDSEASLTSRLGLSIWLTVGGEDRMLPGAVVNDLLAKKLAEIEQKEGRKPGGRTRKRLKDEIITDLMPRAFTKPSRTDAILDLEHGLVIVDSSSRKTAENVISEIRRAVGSFPALPLNAEIAPRSILTGWLSGEPLPEGLSLGDECELRDNEKGVVRCANIGLETDEISKHLESGMMVSRLALNYEDSLSFVIGEDLVIRKLKFLDGAIDKLDQNQSDGLRAELDARFALMSGEVNSLFQVLEKALKLSPFA